MISRQKDYDINRAWRARTKVRGELTALGAVQKYINARIKEKQKELSGLSTLCSRQMGGYYISDHAILRFMEHVNGLEVGLVVEEMNLCSIVEGRTEIDFTVTRDGIDYIFHDRTLLTVKPCKGAAN